MAGVWGSFDRDLRLLFWAMFAWAFGVGLYQPLWPLYLQRLGADHRQVGDVAAISFLAMTVSFLPGGMLAERFDRRRIMLWSWAVATPVPLFYMGAPDWRFVIPALVVYQLTVIAVPAFNAYATARTPPAQLGRTFGVLGTAFPAGVLLSPGLGGRIASAFGIQALFPLAFLCYAVSTLCIAALRPQPPTPAQAGAAWRDALRPNLFGWSAAFGMVYFVLFMPFAFVSPYLETVKGLDFAAIGLLGSVTAAGDAITPLLIGRLAGRIGRLPALGLALLSFGVALVLLRAANSPVALAVAFLLRGTTAASQALMTAAIGALGDRRAGAAMRFGVFGTVTGLAMTLAPKVGAAAYSVEPGLLLVVAGGGAALLALFAIVAAPFLAADVRGQV